jgi:hypothetical protein
MGNVVKIQRVERGQTRSYYLNFPAALADVMQVEKGEAFEWLLEDKNTVWLKRLSPKSKRCPPKKTRPES